MSGLTLALLPGADADPGALTEWLRILTALVAADQPVRLVCTDAGGAALRDPGLPDEAETYLAGMREFGVVPEVLEAPELLDALATARDVFRLGAAGRVGNPALLVVDEVWLAEARGQPGVALEILRGAGQVVRG